MDFERGFDVVVAGGGVAGIAAAVESARRGLRTCLVEKGILTGGLATAGLINIYLPICDGNGRQVTFGLAEEMLHAAMRYGPGNVPPGWREARNAAEEERYRAVFSPASFVLALDEMLEAAGVEPWLDTLAARPALERGAVAGLEVENKSGHGLLRARVVVDATGDADVAFRAGCECALGRNGLTIWALGAALARARKAERENSGEALLSMIRLGADPSGHGAPEGSGDFIGISGRDVSRFAMEGRRLLREHYAGMHREGGEFARSNSFPLTLPSVPQFRKTRRISGRSTLTGGEVGRRFEDSVGLVADWRKSGSVWEVPFGTLVPRGARGLLAAGRCISSEGDAWEVTRVIPGAALTGQAAGAAAAVAVHKGVPPDELDPSEVQRAMAERGVPVHLEEVGLKSEGQG